MFLWYHMIKYMRKQKELQGPKKEQTFYEE